MSDIAGQESTSTEYSEPSGNEAPVETQDHSTGTEQEANPFWGEVEKLTGPNVYKIIQPHLAKADTAARQRVEAVNQSYAPWKALADQGITPQHVQQALGVVHQLNTAPEQVFQSLQSFLEREGRMPNQAELKQEVIEDEAEDGGQPDPRDQELEALRKQVEQLGGFVTNQYQSQQAAQAAQEADSWLETETQRLASKGYDQDDIKEIIRIAAGSLGADGRVPENFDAAAAHFDALRDRIRTTPRPGQGAPRLPIGPGGGSPQGQIAPSTLSKEQRRELVSQMLQRGKQS